MAGLALLLATGGFVFLTLIVWQVMWTLRRPPRRTYSWAVSRGRPGDPRELASALSYASWTFTSRGLSLPVWDVAGTAPAGPVVIVSHGWGDSRLGGLARLESLARGASRVILWDLPGHGEAPGRSSLGVGEVDDLLALIEQVDDAGPIVLYGWSLGAGMSIAAAAREPRVAGVIAEAPYRLAITPAWNVMRLNHLPHRVNLPIAMWLVGMRLGVGPGWRGFDRADHASKLECPLLVVHGSDDEISPVEDGREIAAAAPRGEIVAVEGAGHNDLWSEEAFASACDGAIQEFLVRLTA